MNVWPSSRSGCRRCANGIADLPALVTHFARRFYREEPEATARHQVDGATPAALAALCAYSWPGNIRELRNVIFEALVHKRGGDRAAAVRPAARGCCAARAGRRAARRPPPARATRR